jgi:site-specific DNA recombinase
VLVEVLQDLDQPGSKYERPAFQEALERVERREADGLIVYALDRFARSVPDAAVALRRLEQADAVLVSVRDSLDTSTPVGRFARTMMLALAEMELDRTRENWAIARDRAIARGVHVCRVAPLGYQKDSEGRLEPDPATAPIVREVFVRRGAGSTWQELAAFLDEHLPRDRGAWPLSTVMSMVKRRTYLGEAAAGDVVNRDAHPPLVTRSEWEAAQAKVPRAPRSADGGALLQGLVRCESCGGLMTRMTDGRRRYMNYTCRGRSGDNGVCAAPSKISTRKVDAFVEQEFLSHIEGERIRAEGRPATDEFDDALARVEAAEAELTTYRDANLVSVIGRDAYVAGLEQRAAVVNEARGDLDELLTVDLAATWPELGVSERRTLLAAAIESVDVKREGRPGKGSPADRRVAIRWR